MIRIGILGEIGSGKSFVANSFGYPVFNADQEVSKIYKKDKKIYKKLKRKLPKYISKFPIDKIELTNAILNNKTNLKKIINIVHQEVRRKLKLFLNKHKNKKIIILDVPLLLENKISNKKDNFNNKLFKKFKKIQYPSNYKKRKSHFIIKNNFTKKSVKRDIQYILNRIL